MTEIVTLIVMIFLLIAPFMISDKMAMDRGVTRLGTFIVVLFISWFMILILMFVKKLPEDERKKKPMKSFRLG